MRTIGKIGENLAKAFLENQGYQVWEQNYRFERGEIDIIAWDPEEQCIVFCEVKTFQKPSFQQGYERISPQQRRQIEKVARFFLFERDLVSVPARFDLIEVILELQQINHYKAIW